MVVTCRQGQDQRSVLFLEWRHLIPPSYRMFALSFLCIELDRNKRRQGRPAKRLRDDLYKYWSDTIMADESTRQGNLETAC